MGAPILECRDLRKRFGDVVAVGGVSFRIAEGETYGLLGPNGAGKTTTISIVCGLLGGDGGEVAVGGEPMTTRAITSTRCWSSSASPTGRTIGSSSTPAG
jgi:ABC-2 type transport system ATP-binding protein